MRILIFILALLAAPALAAFDPTDAKPDLVEMKNTIEGDTPGDAVTPLYDWLIKEPNDVDALNLLGYAHRKLGRFDQARIYYDRALALHPAHLGALEYMGELELQTGNPDAAKALLTRLRAACPDGCDELDDLLSAFENSGVQASP